MNAAQIPFFRVRLPCTQLQTAMRAYELLASDGHLPTGKRSKQPIAHLDEIAKGAGLGQPTSAPAFVFWPHTGRQDYLLRNVLPAKPRRHET